VGVGVRVGVRVGVTCGRVSIETPPIGADGLVSFFLFEFFLIFVTYGRVD